MLTELFPLEWFAVSPSTIAGVSLWALALYLGLSGARDWVMVQLTRWFNFAERTLYPSEEEFERTRPARESQNAFYASFLSIFPFLAIGTCCNLGVELTLGAAWAISIGILACIGCSIYELGRQDARSSE